jgi:MYXO-CTERM domain-containing protein
MAAALFAAAAASAVQGREPPPAWESSANEVGRSVLSERSQQAGSGPTLPEPAVASPDPARATPTPSGKSARNPKRGSSEHSAAAGASAAAGGSSERDPVLRDEPPRSVRTESRKDERIPFGWLGLLGLLGIGGLRRGTKARS